MKLLNQLRAACACLVLLSATTFFVSATFLLFRLSERAEGVLERAEATLTDARRVVLSIGGTAAELRRAAKEGSAAAEEQRRYWAQNSIRVGQLLAKQEAAADDFRRVLHQAEITLSAAEGLIADLRVAVKNNDDRAGEIAAQLRRTLREVEGLSRDARARLNDPALAGLEDDTRALIQQHEQLAKDLDALAIELKKTAKTGKWTLIIQALSSVIGAR